MNTHTRINLLLVPLMITAISQAESISTPLSIPSAEQLVGIHSALADDVAEATDAEKSPWTGSVGLSLSGNQASTSTFSARFSASATRKTELEEFNISVSYYFEYKDGTQNENNGNLSANQIWNLGADSPWNIFAQGSWQYDATEGYISRVNAYGGGGYKAINEKDVTLNLKLGLGAQWEYRGNTAVRPQSLMEASNTWQISEGIKFTGNVSIANDLQEFEDYLASARAEIDISVAKIDGLSLNLGIRNVYNSNPSAGSSYNQLWYWVGLKYGF